MFILWVKLIICAGIIVGFGIRLSKAAHNIVKRGSLSEGLMGILFLAAVTSFPEIFTTIASVTKINAINLGIGDLIGSVILNLMVIAMLDLKYNKGSILSSVTKDHVLTCGFSLAMLGILIAGISISAFTNKAFGFFNIGVEGFFLLFIYILALTHTRKYSEKKTEANSAPSKDGRIYAEFALYSLVIIGAGFWLASLGKAIVIMSGYNEMYFGTIIIALTTSLPEIVVCIAAISIGSIDMGLANILGSNLLNIAIIPIADLLFRRGYLLAHISITHIYSALLAFILTAIVLVSIVYRPKRSFMRLGIGTVALISTFIIGNIILFNIIHR